MLDFCKLDQIKKRKKSSDTAKLPMLFQFRIGSRALFFDLDAVCLGTWLLNTLSSFVSI